MKKKEALKAASGGTLCNWIWISWPAFSKSGGTATYRALTKIVLHRAVMRIVENETLVEKRLHGPRTVGCSF
jgi:hypothetical protein